MGGASSKSKDKEKARKASSQQHRVTPVRKSTAAAAPTSGSARASASNRLATASTGHGHPSDSLMDECCRMLEGAVPAAPQRPTQASRGAALHAPGSARARDHLVAQFAPSHPPRRRSSEVAVELRLSGTADLEAIANEFMTEQQASLHAVHLYT